MSVIELKTELHKLIEQVEDEKTLVDWLHLLSNQLVKGDFFEGLSGVQIQSIQRGLNDLSEGRVSSHEDVRNRINRKVEKWGIK
jgi:predicted transcriptional regulator